MRQALDLGLAAIAQRAITLGARLRDQLSGLPGVSTHDLGQTRCAIVTAKVKNRPAEEVAAALGRAAVNVTTTVLLAHCGRASLSGGAVRLCWLGR